MEGCLAKMNRTEEKKDLEKKDGGEYQVKFIKQNTWRIEPGSTQTQNTTQWDRKKEWQDRKEEKGSLIQAFSESSIIC